MFITLHNNHYFLHCCNNCLLYGINFTEDPHKCKEKSGECVYHEYHNGSWKIHTYYHEWWYFNYHQYLVSITPHSKYASGNLSLISSCCTLYCGSFIDQMYASWIILHLPFPLSCGVSRQSVTFINSTPCQFSSLVMDYPSLVYNGVMKRVPEGVFCIGRLAIEGVLVVWSCR